MAERILSPEFLASKAAEVRRLKDDHMQIVQRLKHLVNDLEILDIDEPKRSIVEEINSMDSMLDNYAKALERYAELMDDYANRYAVYVYAPPDVMANKRKFDI